MKSSGVPVRMGWLMSSGRYGSTGLSRERMPRSTACRMAMEVRSLVMENMRKVVWKVIGAASGVTPFFPLTFW